MSEPTQTLPIDDFNKKEGAKIIQIATLFNLLTSWYADKGSQLKWLKTAHPSFKNMLPLDYLMDDEIENALDDMILYFRKIKGMIDN